MHTTKKLELLIQDNDARISQSRLLIQIETRTLTTRVSALEMQIDNSPFLLPKQTRTAKI